MRHAGWWQPSIKRMIKTLAPPASGTCPMQATQPLFMVHLVGCAAVDSRRPVNGWEVVCLFYGRKYPLELSSVSFLQASPSVSRARSLAKSGIPGFSTRGQTRRIPPVSCPRSNTCSGCDQKVLMSLTSKDPSLSRDFGQSSANTHKGPCRTM